MTGGWRTYQLRLQRLDARKQSSAPVAAVCLAVVLVAAAVAMALGVR